MTAKATVVWKTDTGIITEGAYSSPTQGDFSEGKQTATLALKREAVHTDTTYTCRVTSGALPESPHSDATVRLNVYGNLHCITYIISWTISPIRNFVR